MWFNVNLSDRKTMLWRPQLKCEGQMKKDEKMVYPDFSVFQYWIEGSGKTYV